MRKPQYKSIYDRYKQSSKGLLNRAGVTDNKDLSKQHASGKPYRYFLAFFVPKFAPVPHIGQIDCIKSLSLITGENRHKFMAELPAVYVRKDIAKYKSLLGEYAGQLLAWLRVIFGHPMFFHSVLLTQKTTQGGHTHA